MAKMLEDALRSIGILEDDDPAHVASSLLEVVALPRTKGKKGAPPQRQEGDAPHEDHVIITITSP